jgi:hypothetical protein
MNPGRFTAEQVESQNRRVAAGAELAKQLNAICTHNAGKGFVWKCPDCDFEATIGLFSGGHAIEEKHGIPTLKRIENLQKADYSKQDAASCPPEPVAVAQEPKVPSKPRKPILLEKTMHEEVIRWLSLHRDELFFDHSRMDRATTSRVGAADFVIQRGGRVLNIEMKIPGEKPTEKQHEVHAWIAKTGGNVHICYSSAEAIALVKSTLLSP